MALPVRSMAVRREAARPILMATATILAAGIFQYFFSKRISREHEKPKEKPRRHLTLRIHDVQVSRSREDFEEDLKSIIAADLILKETIKTLSSVSLVRMNKHSACGTATFHTSLPDQELVQQLRGASKGKERPYKFDCEFYGITPLYEHETNSQVDLIAVPGLGSHPLGSWKSSTGNEIWLRDYVP